MMQSKAFADRTTFLSKNPMASLLIRLVLILLPLAVFLPSALNASFVGIDDSFHLLNNKELTLGHWWSFWQAPYFSTYIPVTYTVWTALFHLTQEPAAFHILNLVIHILNTLLLFEILTRVFESRKEGAFFGCLVFALHPLQTESVMWVSGLRELLAIFFVFLSVLCIRIKNQPLSLGFGAASFGMSLLAKPIAVLFPFLFVRLMKNERALSKPIRWLFLALLLAFSAALSFGTLFLQNETYSSSGAMSWSPWRILISFESIGFQIKNFLLPIHLSADYGRSLTRLIEKGPEWDLLILALVAGLGLTLQWRKFSWAAQSGFLWMGLALLPNLGLIPFGFEEISVNADRYMTFAMAGMAICLSSVVSQEKFIRFLRPICFSAVLAMALMSFHQARVWTDDWSLMNSILEINPHSKMAAHNLGVYFAKRKEDQKAAEYFRKALSMDDQYILSCSGLITSLSNLGEWKEADRWMKQCLGNEKLLSQYAGTVQLSGLYAAGGYFLLKGPKNFSMSHDYFCESLKHHSDNAFGILGVQETEQLLRQISSPFQPCLRQ